LDWKRRGGRKPALQTGSREKDYYKKNAKT